MARTTGINTNRLAVYMIKSKYKRLEDIIESATEPLQVGDVGQFIFEASHPEPRHGLRSSSGAHLDGALEFSIQALRRSSSYLSGTETGLSILPFHSVRAGTC